MGLSTPEAQMCFLAKSLGADFTDSLMIGRHFFFPDAKALAQMFRWHGIDREAHEVIEESRGWSEQFFYLLGANTVNSIDASPFEGATLMHDLNHPIPDSLRERFSLIYDGGTLEHVFNFPQAIRNCMEMLREGGWFIMYTPANNFMGHGFYQFSPELMYRVFSEENGFAIRAVLLREAVRGGRWYKVADPNVVGKRVQMTNRLPACIGVLTRRVGRVPIFFPFPQQSDYVAAWQRQNGEPGHLYRVEEGFRSRVAQIVGTYFPPRLERLVRNICTPRLGAQPDCYHRLDDERIVLGRL